MKVKIIKANRPTYWYNSEIGEIFDVAKMGDRYEVDDGYGSYIDLNDALEIKTVNCKIDLSWIKGEAREVISREIQNKLFEAGATWIGGKNCGGVTLDYIFVVDDIITHTKNKAKFDGLMDGNWWTKERLAVIPEVSVNNALKGKFWTYSSVSKKEEAPKPDGYKVDLSMYKGKAREAISKAIQEAAFKKGYGWGVFSRDKIIQNTDAQYLFFEIEDKCIMTCTDTNDAFYKLDGDKELSVEEILSGALPQVK
jgi:hypothetical protein